VGLESFLKHYPKGDDFQCIELGYKFVRGCNDGDVELLSWRTRVRVTESERELGCKAIVTMT